MRPVHHAAFSVPAKETRAWSFLRAVAHAASNGFDLARRVGLTLDERGRLQETAEHEAWLIARPDLPAGWSSSNTFERGAAKLLDLYMPLCVGPRSPRMIVAHPGPSAEGHVATFAGTTKFITGAADIEHNHRLRALFDAVLVGASTVAIDDPQLTTRLVPGQTPVRVVLDPNARLSAQHALFRDRAAPTLVVVDATRRCVLPDHIARLQLPRVGDTFDLHELVARLRGLGLQRIFVEGGAVTVGHFLRAGLLDRLQLAVAPVLLGPAPTPHATATAPGLPALDTLSQRVRRFRLGDDVLFDAELTRDTR
jgi:diaminohydroxyphosphoribosylaminopyrimidine deaminase / 5-amino-6-(5-phosphoribosylamino)uracil reductase